MAKYRETNKNMKNLRLRGEVKLLILKFSIIYRPEERHWGTDVWLLFYLRESNNYNNQQKEQFPQKMQYKIERKQIHGLQGTRNDEDGINRDTRIYVVPSL